MYLIKMMIKNEKKGKEESTRKIKKIPNVATHI